MNEPATGTTRPPLRSAAVWVTGILAIMTIPPTLLAGILLWEAETSGARCFALSCILVYVAGCCLHWWLRRNSPRTKAAALVLAGAAFASLTLCYVLAPSGAPPANAKLQSVFPPGKHYTRWTPSGLVPEIDQTKLGADLTPYADSIMTKEKAGRMKALFLVAYREMEHAPDFVAAGSSLGDVFADIGGFPFNAGHLYSYIPDHKAGEKLPVILFLHGSGGNFKAFVWTWKRLADAQKAAIVAPSFGFGNWHHSGGMEAIDIAYEYCRHHPDLDAGRIVLAGLSNGGIGVSRAACRHPEWYRGLIYISPVIEPSVIGSAEFLRGYEGKPVLVLHGGQDERIPQHYVEHPLIALAGKVPVEAKYYPDEDHFLFLSRRDEVLQEIAQWMNRSKL